MKQDLRYWQARLFKEARGGHRHVDGNYSVRIAYSGRRERFQLGTANKYEAAAKARAIYLALVANGWGQTLAKFKTAKAPVKVDITIGEFLTELQALHASKARTLEGYAGALRMIAAEIAEIRRPVVGAAGPPDGYGARRSMR